MTDAFRRFYRPTRADEFWAYVRHPSGWGPPYCSARQIVASALRLIGASVVAVSRGRCRRIGVSWGSQVFSGLAGAYFVRRVGASAIWSLSGEYRTWRGNKNPDDRAARSAVGAFRRIMGVAVSPPTVRGSLKYTVNECARSSKCFVVPKSPIKRLTSVRLYVPLHKMRRLTLDVATRVTRMDRAEPQTRRASRGASYRGICRNRYVEIA